MNYQESKLYNEAMETVDELVEEVLERCCEVADYNNFEKSWVIERFRERFNKKYNEEYK